MYLEMTEIGGVIVDARNRGNSIASAGFVQGILLHRRWPRQLDGYFRHKMSVGSRHQKGAGILPERTPPKRGFHLR